MVVFLPAGNTIRTNAYTRIYGKTGISRLEPETGGTVCQCEASDIAMKLEALRPPAGRDYRLDLLRGYANYPKQLVELDHSAQLRVQRRREPVCFHFRLHSAMVYANMMLDHGFIVAATRLIKRAWQIYVAHVLLFVAYITEIVFLARRYKKPDLENQFDVAGHGACWAASALWWSIHNLRRSA